MQQSRTTYCAQTGYWNCRCHARDARSRLAGPAVVGRQAPGHAGPGRGEGRSWAWLGARPRPWSGLGLEPRQEGWLARARLPARALEAGPLLSAPPETRTI